MYKIIHNSNIARLLVLLSLLMAATNAFADERNVKYQDVFYPNGMPVKDSIYGAGPTEYQLYDEIAIPDTDLTVVVFSEKVINEDEDSDNKYSVFLSILESTNLESTSNVLSIKFLKEITNYLQLSSEPDGYGYFYSVDASLDYFEITSVTDAIHLSIYNILPGSGGISGASDIFFSIGNNQLSPILELTGDAYGGGAGDSLSFSHTFIYLANTDSDVPTDIITQDYNYVNDKTEGIFKSELSPNFDVYKFDNTQNKYNLFGQITSLPSDAIKLDQAIEPDVKALTDQGCCQ